MNKSHVKGTWNDAKGRVKEEVGHASGNDRLAGEGVMDRIKGNVQKGFGDAKDAIKEGVDKLLDKRKGH